MASISLSATIVGANFIQGTVPAADGNGSSIVQQLQVRVVAPDGSSYTFVTDAADAPNWVLGTTATLTIEPPAAASSNTSSTSAPAAAA